VAVSKALGPRKEQILLRMTEEQHALLDAIAYLEETTPAGYVYSLLSDHLVAQTTDPSVRRVVDERVTYRRRRAELRSMAPARARRGAERAATEQL
jgi:hypothetical protein